MSSFPDWAFSHKIELAGTVFGLIYVLFSVRQSLYTWPAGIITSLLYCWVFFDAGFFAMAGLQVYYLIISIYGWWSWKHGANTGSSGEQLLVSRTSALLWIRLSIISVPLTGFIYILLSRYAGSPIPLGEAFTTSLSIIATWMLARKKIEHWIIWIFIDLISAGLYWQEGLYPTVFLFLVYALMAGIGFYEWQKEPEKALCQ
jgi:nicotinamide mononucleotide transporter